MRHLNKFNESKDDSKDDEKKNDIILKLAELVMIDISGSRARPAEEFDLLDLYLLVFGEEKLLHICNILLDERINKNDSNIVLDLDTMEVITDEEYFNIKKKNKDIKVVWYDTIYTMLIDDSKGKITRYLAQWDDVKKKRRR